MTFMIPVRREFWQIHIYSKVMETGQYERDGLVWMIGGNNATIATFGNP